MLMEEPSDTLLSWRMTARGILSSRAVNSATPMPFVSTVTTISASALANRFANTMAAPRMSLGLNMMSEV